MVTCFFFFKAAPKPVTTWNNIPCWPGNDRTDTGSELVYAHEVRPFVFIQYFSQNRKVRSVQWFMMCFSYLQISFASLESRHPEAVGFKLNC